MSHPHILLVSLSAQGHLNPSIQFGNNLTCAGARVTIATTISGFHKLKSLPSNPSLSFASFSDGHDDDINAVKVPGYFHDLKRVGSETLSTLIQTLSKSDDQVNFLIYNLYLPFAATVALELNIPSALLLIQSATSFSIYKRFCNKRDGVVVVNNGIKTSSITLKLPGLPTLFNWGDLPTFVLPKSPYFSDMVSVYQEHIELLQEHPDSFVLVNTLDGLEPESIETINNGIVIGPLVSTSISSNRGSYLKWLDRKQEKSVVYVSFGTLAVLTKAHKKELLHGLIESGHAFLMVLRDNGEYEDMEINELRENLGEDGLIVEWCAQMEVLRHQAIGCFVSHCGWNSTLESMVAGVAVVGYPQFSDQKTNAKMVEEIWRNGVRVIMADDDAIEAPLAGREEIKRCLEVVMGGGDMAEEIQKNVEKWKVAEESLKEGGTSQRNIKLLMEKISIN